MTTDRHPRDADLAARVHQRTRVVIDAELRRLARRAPGLRERDLAAVDAALEELAERLIVGRLRSARPEAMPLLERVFDSVVP